MSAHFRCAIPLAPLHLPFPLCLLCLRHNGSTLLGNIFCCLLLLTKENCQSVQMAASDEHHLGRERLPSIGANDQHWSTAEWETTSANFLDSFINTREEEQKQQPNVYKSAYISLSDFEHSVSSTSVPNSLILPTHNKNSITFFAASTSTQTMISLLAEEGSSIKSNSSARNSSSNSSNLFSFAFSWDIFLTLILPYSIIFVLAVVGNLLVIITLTRNRSMRSVTNIFLLNLAISDLLLGVFCMPATLVGVLLRRFIFGRFMCHLISYMQSKAIDCLLNCQSTVDILFLFLNFLPFFCTFSAVSVAVSVWTLVAMSIERYYAICQPLHSREHRQTRRHAYRILALVWTLAILLMLPTAIVSELQLIKQTGR